MTTGSELQEWKHELFKCVDEFYDCQQCKTQQEVFEYVLADLIDQIEDEYGPLSDGGLMSLREAHERFVELGEGRG